MRRSRYLMMMLAAVLLWWAVRLAPSALALASATVNFGGSLQSGQGTPFVTCTAPANLSPAFLRRKNSQSGTVQVTCTNNMDIAVTVTLTTGTLTPSGSPTPPGRSWAPPNIALTKAGTPTATGSATLTVSTTPATTTGNYSLVFTTTVIANNGLEYSKNHTVSFLVVAF